MSTEEKEIIDLFSEFGYTVAKIGTKYHVFDRRCSRRITECRDLSGLYNLAEEVYFFDFMRETLNKTIIDFRRIFMPATSSTDDHEQDPEQWETSAPETAPEQPAGDHDTTAVSSPETLYEKTCPSCGKVFQTSIKQRKYCSESCYPSEMKKKQQEPQASYQLAQRF